MASTDKPPDPMPCALAALLLPESRAHCCHVQETLFPEPALRASGGVRAQAVPARGVRSCGVREQREPGQQHGCGGSVPGAAGGLHPLVESCSQPVVHVGEVCEWACGGLGDAVSSRSAGSDMRARLGWCGVQ
jgi:hypothetical protein